MEEIKLNCTATIGAITINRDRSEPITVEVSFQLGILHKDLVEKLKVSVPEVPSMAQFLKEVEEELQKKLKLEVV